MKCFILLAIVCATIGFSEQAISKGEVLELFQKVFKECAGKEGASAADLEELGAKKLPSSRSAKCMHACAFEKFGFMKDNKGSADAYIALAKEVFGGDAASIQKASDIANECINISDADRCEAAAKLGACVGGAAQKRGVSVCFGEW